MTHPYTRLFSGNAAPPTVDEDSGAGYEVGDEWIVPGTASYKALDVSVGAAVWEELTGAGGGSPNWGDILGTLSDQTDLQSALDGKLDNSQLEDTIANGVTTKAPSQNAVFDALVTTLATATTYADGVSNNASVIAKVLTAFAAGAGTVSSSDSILTAFQKVVGNIALKLTANSAITGATKTKITYDANGLVTAGADATTADIADSSNKRYVTDAQQTVIGNTSGTNTGDQNIGATINSASAETTIDSADKVGFWDASASLLKAITYINLFTQIQNALLSVFAGFGDFTDHDHDNSETVKLTQANTHQSPDTDTGTSSLHHTLGSGANQAAAGNHNHTGVYTTKAILQHMTHVQSATIPASTTYWMVNGIDGLMTSERGMPILRAGTVKNLYVRTNTNQPASGSLVVTIRKNTTTDTVVTLTVAAGAGSGVTNTDLTHSFTVAAGDFVGVKLQNNATAASAQLGFIAFEIECDP